MNCHNALGLSQDVEAVIINPDRNLNTLIEKVRFFFRTLNLAEELELVRDSKTLNEPGDRGRKHQNRSCSKPKHLSECDRPIERNFDESNDLAAGIESPCFCEGILEEMSRQARPGEDRDLWKPTIAWVNHHR